MWLSKHPTGDFFSQVLEYDALTGVFFLGIYGHSTTYTGQYSVMIIKHYCYVSEWWYFRGFGCDHL
jgi:hypothetical protein